MIAQLMSNIIMNLFHVIYKVLNLVYIHIYIVSSRLALQKHFLAIAEKGM